MTKQMVSFNGIIMAIFTPIIIALGGWDVVLQVLVSLVVMDYLTGVTVAILNKSLSSEVGYKGLIKKVFIFAMVYVSVLVDKATNADVFRTMTILFYIANEGISVLENGGKLGVPYPEALKNVLIQLKDKNNGGATK